MKELRTQVAIVGAGLGLVLLGTAGNHLELKGTILKVRVLPLSPTASLAIVDFRVTDPSDVPFVLKGATLSLEPASGAILETSLEDARTRVLASVAAALAAL